MTFPTFRKVLIANRGEIARRVIRACHELGIAAVAVYSDVDERAPWVREADEAYPLHGSTAAETYLDREKILTIATNCGAEAIHPGYGFLSENADFAAACAKRGVVFVGPPPEAMRALGSKAAARSLARQMLGGGHELFQAGRTQQGRLDETQDLLLVNDGQAAIHAVMKGNPPAGEVEAHRHGRQGDDLTKQADGVVIGHGPPVGEMDLLVGLGQGKPGAVGRAGLGGWLSEAVVEPGQIAMQDGIGLGDIGRLGPAQFLDQTVLQRLKEALDPSLGLRE